MKKKRNILICPLDWGLGHASRCVPIIKKLQENDLNIIIAAGEKPLSFLEKEFPELDFIAFKGLQIHYPENSSMAWKMAGMYPGIKKWIASDHMKTEELAERYKIDAVVSDNRFGCYSSKIPSVYISHQLSIKAKGILRILEPFLQRMHNNIIKKYTICWVPDFNNYNNSLAGDLTMKHNLPVKHNFIGPQSQFKPDLKKDRICKYDILAILSGPEPQRTILENILKREFSKINKKTVMVLGKMEGGRKDHLDKNIHVYHNLQGEKLQDLIQESKIVICRSGYSSLMDMFYLGKKAIFIPTPGQTEQEYLAEYHKKKGNFYYEHQKTFNIERALKESSNYSPTEYIEPAEMMQNAIDRLKNIVK